MSKYIYSNKVAESKSKQSLVVSSLMGVDLREGSINTENYHAKDILNLLKINNVLQKRPSIESISPKKYNGLWKFTYKSSKVYYIAHIGKQLYYYDGDVFETNDIVQIYDKNNEHSISSSVGKLEDKPSVAFVTSDRIYILSNKYYVLKYKSKTSTFELSEVYNDVDTYIPTTTIGITSQSVVNNKYESISSIKRTQLDDTNMLSPYVYNKANTFYNEADGFIQTVFYFDREIIKSNITKTEITMKVLEDNAVVTKIFRIRLDTQVDYEEYSIIEGNTTVGVVILDDNKTKALGLKFENKYINPVESEDNVTIKLYCPTTDYELINKCTIGIMYGTSMAGRNRLFLSGNPDYPNADYHSRRRNIYANDIDIDLQDEQDLTYFSVNDYCGYGTSNTAITGYQIMGDGTLLVIKEPSNTEPSIYFRKATYETKNITYTDTNNKEQVYTQLYEETFPLTVGNIGEGCNVKNSIANLNNDIVFLTPNGLYGMSATISASSVTGDYRYAFKRSRLIENKLISQMKSAKSITTALYDNRYFITIKDNEDKYITYVADGRHKYKLADDIDNEYQYEWYIIDGFEADRYYVIDDRLYLTSDNGTFEFNINSKKRVDDLLYKTNIGETVGTVEISNGNPIEDAIIQGSNVIISNKLVDKFNLKDKETIFTLYDTENYYMVFPNGEITSDENNYAILITDNDFIKRTYKDRMFYYNNGMVFLRPIVNEENKYYIYYNLQLHIHIKYYENVDNKIYCQISDKDIFRLAYKGNKFIIKDITDTITYIIKFTDEITDGEVMGAFDLPMVLKLSKIIPCYYLTKAYNMSQSIYEKVLRKVSIINDSELLSYTNFGIITKDEWKRFKDTTISGTSGLSGTYENIFNTDITSQSFASSFTKDFLLKFNFIQFEFYNEDENNCVLNNLSIIYTIGIAKKGAY